MNFQLKNGHLFCNSRYTNAAAAIALNFATEAAGVLGKTADPAWMEVADGLALKVSDDIPLHPELTGGYHPEYDGFPKNANKKPSVSHTCTRPWPTLTAHLNRK